MKKEKMMNRTKSLGALTILLLGLFLLGGCGNNTEQGVIEAGGGSVTLVAADTTVAEGNSTVLTATVAVTRKDSKGVYVTDHYPGQAVTFVIISNNTGGTVIPMNGGITNADGVASAVYTAGKLKKGLVEQDTIQAHIAGYSGQVIITRSGAVSGYKVIIDAKPPSVKQDGSSVITAKVVESTTEVPVSGQVVTFSFSSNHSGGYLTTLNGVTGADGIATAEYRAGNNNPTLTVTDTIQASSGGSTSAIVVTRTGAQTETEYTITVKANPETLPTTTGVSIITATVKDGTGYPAAGIKVQFILSGTSGGSVTPDEVATDANGEAVAIFTGAAPSGRAYIEARTGEYGGGLGGSAVTTVTVP